MPIGYVNFETLDRNGSQRNLRMWSEDGTVNGNLIRLNILARTDGTPVDPLTEGAAGSSPPSLASGASGLIGWLRKIVDTLTSGIAITAAALPLPSGAATAAKQPALGTAGSASTDVLTVQGIASGTPLAVSTSSTQRTGSIVRATSSSSIATGSFSASVTNVGSANGTVAGVTLAVGESISWQAPMGDTLASISYDATGTTFLISRVA